MVVRPYEVKAGVRLTEMLVRPHVAPQDTASSYHADAKIAITPGPGMAPQGWPLWSAIAPFALHMYS